MSFAIFVYKSYHSFVAILWFFQLWFFLHISISSYCCQSFLFGSASFLFGSISLHIGSVFRVWGFVMQEFLNLNKGMFCSPSVVTLWCLLRMKTNLVTSLLQPQLVQTTRRGGGGHSLRRNKEEEAAMVRILMASSSLLRLL